VMMPEIIFIQTLIGRVLADANTRN